MILRLAPLCATKYLVRIKAIVKWAIGRKKASGLLTELAKAIKSENAITIPDEAKKFLTVRSRRIWDMLERRISIKYE